MVFHGIVSQVSDRFVLSALTDALCKRIHSANEMHSYKKQAKTGYCSTATAPGEVCHVGDRSHDMKIHMPSLSVFFVCVSLCVCLKATKSDWPGDCAATP